MITMSKTCFQDFAYVVYLIVDLEVKGHKCQGQRHMGQGQRSHWSRLNKDSKQRQVGSQQRQVASFILSCSPVIYLLHRR